MAEYVHFIDSNVCVGVILTRISRYFQDIFEYTWYQYNAIFFGAALKQNSVFKTFLDLLF